MSQLSCNSYSEFFFSFPSIKELMGPKNLQEMLKAEVKMIHLAYKTSLHEDI